jgi:hypothetical protein
MQRLSDLKIMAVVLAGSAIGLLWPGMTVKAFNPQPDPPAFGMIGVDPYETARLNAVCATGPLPGGVSPGPCDVTLAFLDINGRSMNQVTRTLRPGQGTSLDLIGAGSSALRTQVQPFVPAAGSGFVLVTVEKFDSNTGRTTALLNPTQPKSLARSTAP